MLEIKERCVSDDTSDSESSEGGNEQEDEQQDGEWLDETHQNAEINRLLEIRRTEERLRKEIEDARADEERLRLERVRRMVEAGQAREQEIRNLRRSSGLSVEELTTQRDQIRAGTGIAYLNKGQAIFGLNLIFILPM